MMNQHHHHSSVQRRQILTSLIYDFIATLPTSLYKFGDVHESVSLFVFSRIPLVVTETWTARLISPA